MDEPGVRFSPPRKELRYFLCAQPLLLGLTAAFGWWGWAGGVYLAVVRCFVVFALVDCLGL